MESAGQNGHLVPSGGREVVYCHACANEWWRHEGGLVCPRCESDITEIINLDSDPRFEMDESDDDDADDDDYPHHLDHHIHEHSDPSEADIDAHLDDDDMHFHHHHRDRDTPGHQGHLDPVFGTVMEGFVGLIQGFAAPPQHPGRATFVPLTGAGGNEQRERQPNVRHTVMRAGNTSVTIVSGPAAEFMNNGPPPDGRPVDPFSAYLAGALRGNAAENPWQPGSPGPGGPGDPGGVGHGHPLARDLARLLGMLTQANAVTGDAVYSQEALDRIITNLMEAQAGSNAAPPASEAALDNLDRRIVDKAMLLREAFPECTICIEAYKEGDQAAYLPCTHWFHEDCVVLWLKEHNTCPVCRASIERGGGGGGGSSSSSSNNNNNSTGNASSATGSSSSGSGINSPVPQQNPSLLRRATSSVSGGGIPILNNHHHHHHRSAPTPRPPSHSQSRINEVLRNITSRAPERDLERDRERERDLEERRRERQRDWMRGWGEPMSGYSDYDTSRLQRRNSLSPTSPRQSGGGTGEYRRTRQRSPSQGSGPQRESRQNRETRDAEPGGPGPGPGPGPGRATGSGALNWFRETFANRGNANREPPRE